MRAKNIRHFLSLAIPVVVLGSAGFCSAQTNATSAKEADKLSPILKGTNASAAWDELRENGQPPPGPASWSTTPPTPQERQTYYLPFVRALALQAKDFYTRFPTDEHAPKAKLLEFRFLSLLVMWGDASQQANLDAMERALVKDPALADPDHVTILQQVAEDTPPDKLRPFLEEVLKGSPSPNLKEAATAQLNKMDALGKPLNIQFTAVDGRKVDLSKLKGKVVLVDFWATWCGPCVGEVPNVKKTYDEYHSKGFEIVGISLDKDKDKLTAFTSDHHMEWPQYFDGLFWQNKYAKQFAIESIPAMWLVDKKGNLRDMNAREDLPGGVQKLLAE